MPILDTFTTAFDFKADLQGLKRIQDQIQGTSDKLDSLSAPLIKVGAAFTGFATGATIAFAQAQTKTQEYVGLIGLTQKEADELTKTADRLAQTYGAAMDEVQAAGFTLASSGQRGITLMQSLEATTKGAAAGLGSVADVGNAVAKSMNNWSKDGLTAIEVVDGIVETAKVGLVSASDLATVYADVGSTMNTMGVSFQETSGLLARLSLGTASASVAGTQLSAVVRAILKPTGQMKRALDAAGLGAEELKQKITRDGLLNTLLELQEQTGKTNTEFAQMFGRAEAISGVGIILADLDDTKSKVAELGDSAQETDKAWQAVKDIIITTFRQFRQAMGGFMRVIGEGLAPVVQPILKFLADMTGWLTQFLDKNKFLRNMVATFVALGAALLPVGLGLKGIAVALRLVGKTASVASLKLAGVTFGLNLLIPLAIDLWQRFKREPKEATEEVDLLTEAMKGLTDETGKTKKELIELSKARLLDLSTKADLLGSQINNYESAMVQVHRNFAAGHFGGKGHYARQKRDNALEILEGQIEDTEELMKSLNTAAYHVNERIVELETSFGGLDDDPVDAVNTLAEQIKELEASIKALEQPITEEEQRFYNLTQEVKELTDAKQKLLELNYRIAKVNDQIARGEGDIEPLAIKLPDVAPDITPDELVLVTKPWMANLDAALKQAHENWLIQVEDFAYKVDRVTGEIMWSIAGIVSGDTSVADAFRNLGKQALYAFAEYLNKKLVAQIVANAFGGSAGGGGLVNLLGGAGTLVGGGVGGSAAASTGLTVADAVTSQVAASAGEAAGTGFLSGIGKAAAGAAPILGKLATAGSLIAMPFAMAALRGDPDRKLKQDLAKHRQNSMWNQLGFSDRDKRLSDMLAKGEPIGNKTIDDALEAMTNPSSRFYQNLHVGGPASVQGGQNRGARIGNLTVNIDAKNADAKEVMEEVYRVLSREDWETAGDAFYSSRKL